MIWKHDQAMESAVVIFWGKKLADIFQLLFIYIL